MHDLLKEEEFLKKQYNPWKLFYTFYAIAFIQLILFVGAIVFLGDTAGYKTGLVALALPTITALIMFFFNKKIALLPTRTIAFSLFILLSIYYVPVLILALAGDALNNLLVCLGLMAVNYFFCFAIMFVIARSKKRKASANT